MDVTYKTQIKVGVFVGLGLIAIVVCIYFLGGSKIFLKKYYPLHAQFDQVQGLAEGSIVSLSGVVVGNIEAINFVDNTTLDVVLSVDEHFKPRITEGSRVEIRTQGALGDKYIYIIPGPRDGTPVPPEGTLKKADPTDFLGVLTEKGDQATKIFGIIEETHKLLATLNENNKVGRLSTHLVAASENLMKTLEMTQNMLREIRGNPNEQNKIKSSLDKLDRILTKIDKGEGTLGALINDSSLHEQIKAMLGGSQRSKNIKSLIRTSIEKSEQ